MKRHLFVIEYRQSHQGEVAHVVDSHNRRIGRARSHEIQAKLRAWTQVENRDVPQEGGLMLIRKHSILTGELNEMDIPVTIEKFLAWGRARSLRIQQAFPGLDAGQREFLISGTTPEEWTAAFGGKE